MTQMQIIRRLWSIIYDLILCMKGGKGKNIEEIESEIFEIEKACNKYAEEEGDMF